MGRSGLLSHMSTSSEATRNIFFLLVLLVEGKELEEGEKEREKKNTEAGQDTKNMNGFLSLLFSSSLAIFFYFPPSFSVFYFKSMKGKDILQFSVVKTLGYVTSK